MKKENFCIHSESLKLKFDDFKNQDIIEMLLSSYNIKIDDCGRIKTYQKSKEMDDEEEVKFEYSL